MPMESDSSRWWRWLMESSFPKRWQLLPECAGRPDKSLLEQVAQTLKEQHLVLVLDNCEHVLDAGVEVAGAFNRIF
jgi:hypothetical protein